VEEEVGMGVGYVVMRRGRAARGRTIREAE